MSPDVARYLLDLLDTVDVTDVPDGALHGAAVDAVQALLDRA